MKTKKNAFTLIELLAVIVILAIIALIATPIILGIIKDTKDQANERSAEMYLNALNNSIVRQAIHNKKIDNGRYIILENGNICLEYSENKCINELKVDIEGTIPIGGIIIIEKGLVINHELIYNEEIIKQDSEGNLTSIKNIYSKTNDNNPKIICGEGVSEDLTQTICYIKSIEDLVAFSNNASAFEGKTVELVNNLDFINKNSYASEKVNISLITGEGFKSIGNSSKSFKGTFEGNNNTIRGLYINRPETGNPALFGYIDSATIQNLNIEGATVIGGANSGILVGYNNLGTIQNINLSNTNLSSGGRHIGSLVGNNQSGTIKNIKAQNIKVSGGQYYETGGLIGLNKGGTIENIELENIQMINDKYSAGGMVGDNTGTIQNVKARNININAYYYAGGLIGNNKGAVQDIEIENIEINGKGNYAGGLIAVNNQGSIKNVQMKDIKILNLGMWAGGLVGSNSGDILNIIGNNIEVGKNRYSGGLVGSHYSGEISLINLKNINVNASDRIGLLAGSIEQNSILKNSVVEGNITGSDYIGLITGWCNACSIDTIVAKGNIEGTRNNIGGLVGNVVSTSEVNANISGVYLSGNLKFIDNATNNRMIGDKGPYSPIFKTLVSDKVTINGNKVESTDISSVEGKSLTNMGKVSQSEYEAIGFEFESTDTNECYWYFNDNDELDLKIK